MDYGQNILLSIGNFLCSTRLVNLTMDFSKKLVEDGVVDSLVEKKVQVVVIYLPSSLHATELKVATKSDSDVVRLMQRKVYEDANYGTLVTEVSATCLNDRHDVRGHVALSTLSRRRQNVLSTVQVLKRKREARPSCQSSY